MLLNRLLLTLFLLIVPLVSAESFAQFGSVARPAGGGAVKSTGGMMGNSPLALINDQKVIKELELSDDQVNALRELQNDMQEVFRKSFSQMRYKFRDEDVDRGPLMGEIREMIQSKLGAVETVLTDILLPHQKTRLDELHLQMQANRSGTIGLLNNPKIKERLGLTDKEIEAFEEKFDEVREATEEKIKAIREEAKEELLSDLTSEQRAKIKEMLGDKFKFGESGLGEDENDH